MDCEHKLKVLEQEIESLKEENRLLKEKLSSSEKNFDGVSFKEKYAVRILDSLPDMLTVFNHEEMGIEVVSNEETNHVGVSNNDFKGMRMQDMVPKEAYHNIHNNLQKVISTGRGSTAHHELDVDGMLHYYENRIFPLDEEYVLIMCRDISERVATQQNLEIFKRVLDKVSDSILAVSADGTKVLDAVVARSGITGEKMELDGYNFIEGENISTYDHMGKHTLCTMVQTNKAAEEQAHAIAMQVAAMKPMFLDEASVSQEFIEEEKKVAAEKTKQELVQKAVDAALKKAGINPAHVDSEEHMESNMGKGWITAEDVAKAKEIIATVSAEKAANLPAQMIENIVKGRINRIYKENCLLNQEFIQDSKLSVADYLKAADKDLTVVDYKRFSLSAD